MSPKKPRTSFDSMASTSEHDDDFTEGCRNLILTASNGLLTDEDEDLIKLIADCSKHFLEHLVGESAANAETSNISYDDILEVVHSSDDPSFNILRESFRQRLTYNEIVNQRKKKMKSQWFFDYTHFNKQKDEDQQQQKPKTPKEEKSSPKKQKDDPVMNNVDLNETEESEGKKRKIIPKKQFYD